MSKYHDRRSCVDVLGPMFLPLLLFHASVTSGFVQLHHGVSTDEKLSFSGNCLPKSSTLCVQVPSTGSFARKDGNNRRHRVTRSASPLLPNFVGVGTLPRKVVSPALRKIGLFGAAILTGLLNYRRILWPGSLPDASFDEPLPPGRLGCPLLGVAGVVGPFDTSKRKNEPLDFDQSRIWFVYAFMAPFVLLSGSKNIKQLANSEFEASGATTTTFFRNERKLFGENLLMSNDKEEHSFLRRLIGNAMTPTSIAKALPQLQQTASEHVQRMLQSPSATPLVAEDIFKNFTLDVAGRQILGLNLTKSEESQFNQALDSWLQGFFSLRTMILPGLRLTRAWKARKYLVKLIETKVQQLEERGPDGSTLSAMVFAIDEDSTCTGQNHRRRKLSRSQIVDNVLFLMLAGSETSASTLVNAMLLLGLHTEAWYKLVQEQRQLCERKGETLTKSILDNDCPYLEAVIKETMRIKPISGGQWRRSEETMIVDGRQVPKGWAVGYSIRRTHELDPSTRKDDGSHMDIKHGFVPERWFDITECPQNTEFMPFGSGPRYCLGSALAMAEMKTFLAIMARKVDFDLITDIDSIEWKKLDIIAVPKDGVVISVRPARTAEQISNPTR